MNTTNLVRIVCTKPTGFEAKITLEDGTLLPFVMGADIRVSADAMNTAQIKLIPGEVDVTAAADLEPLICLILRGMGHEVAKKLLNNLYWEWHGDDEPPVKPE